MERNETKKVNIFMQNKKQKINRKDIIYGKRKKKAAQSKE